MHRDKQPKFGLAGEVADTTIGTVILAYLVVQLDPCPQSGMELGSATKSDDSRLDISIHKTRVEGYHQIVVTLNYYLF